MDGSLRFGNLVFEHRGAGRVWFIATVLKTAGLTPRGFESFALRQKGKAMHFDDANRLKEVCDAFGIDCSVHEPAARIMERADENYTLSPFGSIETDAYHVMVLDRRFAYAQSAQKFVDVVVDDIRKQAQEKKNKKKKKKPKRKKRWFKTIIGWVGRDGNATDC